MKNVMVYISPTASSPDKKMLQMAKIQLNSSFKLGWKAKDIIFVTNFPFEYGDVKALVIKDVPYYNNDPKSTKINAVIKLYEGKIIKKNQLYWLHDLDTFQVDKIKESDMGYRFTSVTVSDYGGIKYQNEDKLSTASMFFRLSAKNIFSRIQETMYKKRIDSDEALTLLNRNDEKITSKIKKLDYTYNFTGYNFKQTYEAASKPIKIVNLSINPYEFFRKNNPLNTSLLGEGLVRSFKYHHLA